MNSHMRLYICIYTSMTKNMKYPQNYHVSLYPATSTASENYISHAEIYFNKQIFKVKWHKGLTVLIFIIRKSLPFLQANSSFFPFGFLIFFPWKSWKQAFKGFIHFLFFNIRYLLPKQTLEKKSYFQLK